MNQVADCIVAYLKQLKVDYSFEFAFRGVAQRDVFLVRFTRNGRAFFCYAYQIEPLSDGMGSHPLSIDILLRGLINSCFGSSRSFSTWCTENSPAPPTYMAELLFQWEQLQIQGLLDFFSWDEIRYIDDLIQSAKPKNDFD